MGIGGRRAAPGLRTPQCVSASRLMAHFWLQVCWYLHVMNDLQ